MALPDWLQRLLGGTGPEPDPYADITSDLEAREKSERLAREHLIPVSSSWVRAYGYDPMAGTLYVQFHKKGHATVVVAYHDVHANTWNAFQGASSKGKFIHESGLLRWPYRVVG